MGLLERGGKVLTFVVPNTEADILLALMVDHVDKDCVLITNSYKAYNGLSSNYNHIKVKH